MERIYVPKRRFVRYIVVTALLVIGTSVALPVTGMTVQSFWPRSAMKSVWCYEIVQHNDGTLSITGHQPPAIKNFPIGAGDKLKARCFASWSDAASFLSGGKVKLPKNASEKDYEAATETLTVDNSHVLTVLSEP